MSCTNALRLAKLPSRITSCVSSPKNRSTKFIQEELVGVK